MKGLVFVTLCASLLLVGMISSQSFGSNAHPYILEWGGFDTTERETDCFLCAEYYRTVQNGWKLPQQIAVDDERNIYVADTGNSRIQKFTHEGQFLSSWGTNGVENGELQSPVGIAIYENNVYVVDEKQNTVQKFDNDGNFILKWGERGNENGQFSSPQGITIDSSGIVYVADSKNHRIQQFTSDGEFLSSFGKFGYGDGKLKTPVDVAVYGDFIYVSDPGGYKIEKYTSDGIFLKSFDYNFGGFSVRPGGLTVDPNGNIYFVDAAKYRVVKINSDGRTLATWGSIGKGDGKFIEPKDLVLDNRGYLFVLDSSLGLVQKFETPVVMQIEEALQVEQFRKMQELAYAEESDESETKSDESETEPVEETSTPDEPVVPDTTKPIISPPVDLVIEATGSLTPVDLGEAIAMDESGIQLIVSNGPTLFPLGSSTIIWTAIDNNGNSAFATQQVDVVDTTPPTISLIPDIIVEAVVPYDNIVELQAPSADDILGVVSITNDAPEFFSIGETIVTWTATDVGGNTASIEQKITVFDTIFPILQVPENIVIEATSLEQNEVDLGEATATDNGKIASITNDAPEFFPLGETTVTWTAIDSSNNFSSLTQLVSVIDTNAPEISPLEDITLEATSVDANIVNLDNPTVSDIQDATIYIIAPDVFPVGETTVTWTVVDSSGNSASAIQTVIIVDTTKPGLSIPQDKTVEASSLQETLVEIGQAEAHDITGISSIVHNAPDVFPLGSTLIAWTATDNHGNITTAYQIVTVVDTITPTIISPQDIIAEAIDPTMNYIELGELVASDSVGIESITNDKPITFPLGSTTVTWTVADTLGNISQVTQVVTLVDTTPPEIFAPSDIVTEAVGLSSTMIELGKATAHDVMGIASVTEHPPRFFVLGETTITWTATDTSGNSASTTQVVSVVDTIAPSITAPDSVTAEATSADSNIVVLGNPVSSDLVDTPSISNDAPDVFPLGETTITWTATDTSGNSASAIQTVTVVDTTAPELTMPEDVMISAFSLEKQVEIGEAQAHDSVDSTLTITNDAPDTFPLGDTVVTWNVSDEFGNSSSSQQVISVQPCGKPLSYYNQIFGTPAADTIVGTGVADLIFAFGGNDMIFGGEGNDCIIGGDGDDIIFGNAGNDHLVGGEGNDILKGYSGDDKLTGGIGYDILDGGDDFDVSYDSASDIIIKCEEQL
uniref:Putative NHL repeat protein n=1 Tax=uncultured marine crenarchaeote HF4000_ANIW93H17 TaxID=455564 RepID=B3T2U6_9ARCH|nr:putative NHL repeat protein [uncultured marine crenarchaeote HF4000_ANIW93H17]